MTTPTDPTGADGWGDPCDHQPTRADSHPGATERCDGRDNDGDGVLAFNEDVDFDLDEAMACADCADLDPAVFPCACESCTNVIDDDCDTFIDVADSECTSWPTCVRVASGAEPVLTMAKGACSGGGPAGLYEVIRGVLDEPRIVSGSVDLGPVACVAGALGWDRVTETSAAPNPSCNDGSIFLVRNAGAGDFGHASTGEPRDAMSPDPPCP